MGLCRRYRPWPDCGLDFRHVKPVKKGGGSEKYNDFPKMIQKIILTFFNDYDTIKHSFIGFRS